MGHKDASKAANPGTLLEQQQGGKKEKKERTAEDAIRDLRANREAKLHVSPTDVDFLLAEYDKEKNAVATLGPATAALLKRAEDAEQQVREYRDRELAKKEGLPSHSESLVSDGISMTSES